MGQFGGVVPAIISPKNEDGTLNEEAFRAVMEFNIQAGVHGFWVAGGTGESVLLDDEENQRIAEIAADQNQGRTQIIMHVGANTTARAEKLAAHAAQVGVEAVCAVPPFFYQGDEDGVVEYYRVVGAAAQRPLFIYNLPSCTGLDVSPGLMQRLVEEVPQTAGLKHSSRVFAHMLDFARMEIDAFIGSGKLMLPALTIGAVGAVDGPLIAAPELWVAIWEAYQAGDLAAAQQAQERAGAFHRTVAQFGYFGSVMAVAGARVGIDCGSPRPPLRALQSHERELLFGQVEAFGLAGL
ncbi:MAG: hypothetical protein GKR89_22425 [Candidatus Latescibacteria bacterium]|nr:hypothetical protein [Candidatus Latescibacterota bacterium]